MKVKHLALVVAVLVVLSLGTLLLKRGGETPALDPREGQPVIDAALLEQVAGLFIASPNGDVDVARSAEAGGKWVVRNYHELPADFSKIGPLIQNLREANITRSAGSRPERIATLGFEGTRLELRDAEGKALRTLHIGRSSDSGGRFIKYDDETKAYLSSFTAFLDTTAKNWADTALFHAKPEEITALTINFPDGGALHVTRENSSSPWTSPDLAEGEKLKESEITSLVSKFTGLRFNETAEPDDENVQAARTNSRSFQLTLANGKVYDVALGRKPAPPAPPAEDKPAEETKDPDGDSATNTTPPAPQPGPVYAFVTSSDASDPINDLMKRRGFQIYEWTYTSLPANRAALVESAPTPATEPVAESAPATESAPAAEPDPASETETPADAATPASEPEANAEPSATVPAE